MAMVLVLGLAVEEISSGLGLRYVTEKFTSEKTQKTYQADHVGVFFMMYF